MNQNKIIYTPKNRNLNKVKWLGICAHQDDAEIMAIDGILKGYYSKDYSFALIETTDGVPQSADISIKDIRNNEQMKASEIGHYHLLYLLNYTSKEAKDEENEDIINDYIKIIRELRPEVIYTHSILDKHKTHVGVVKKVIEAIRRLPKEERPKAIYGCEVWRSLDFVTDDKKIIFDVSKNLTLQKKLLDVYVSQIKDGKAYSDATIARRKANATFCESHENDKFKLVSYSIDLTPLILDDNLSIKDYATTFIDNLKKDILNNL